jgi:hypothetical protein
LTVLKPNLGSPVFTVEVSGPPGKKIHGEVVSSSNPGFTANWTGWEGVGVGVVAGVVETVDGTTLLDGISLGDGVAEGDGVEEAETDSVGGKHVLSYTCAPG